MTERLYYTDPDLMEFDATIVRTGRHKDGFFYVLDRSAFYPTSGGQSHDVGTLNGVQVNEVIEEADEVWHLTGVEIGSVGLRVRGIVDRERRRRNCQSHTAQHIISASCARQYGFRTVSVHLGVEYSAVELETESVSPEQLTAIEEAANRVVGDNVEVEIRFVDASQAAMLPLRKEPQREGELRVIRIGEFDYSACGGTHCRTSGGVGLVKIVGCDRIRGRALVNFLAGDLAVADYHMRFGVTNLLARSFTCHPSDLVAKVDKIATENKEIKTRLVEAQKQLLPIRVTELTRKVRDSGRVKFVLEKVADLDPAMTSRLAALVADGIGGLAVLAADGPIILATSPGSGLHAGNLAKEIARQSGLKGGGSERAAQLGGAVNENPEAYLEVIQSVLAHA
ncbi:MAG: DHHA1 domain-containing protein [candidate division Zixibacteria bacterium]|nr:DHHA1 domain-containing protein [candidate division Zixibacteria bacterium]